MAFVDHTVVSVAFPNLLRSFPHAGLSSLSWVISAYNIVFAAFLVPAGRVADLLGRRRVFSAGIVLFTIASGLCAVAPTVETLIAARAVQALGAGRRPRPVDRRAPRRPLQLATRLPRQPADRHRRVAARRARARREPGARQARRPRPRRHAAARRRCLRTRARPRAERAVGLGQRRGARVVRRRSRRRRLVRPPLGVPPRAGLRSRTPARPQSRGRERTHARGLGRLLRAEPQHRHLPDDRVGLLTASGGTGDDARTVRRGACRRPRRPLAGALGPAAAARRRRPPVDRRRRCTSTPRFASSARPSGWRCS